MLSIITPVLNGANFIEENINAIMELEIPYEHIIVDGGSTDGTIEVVKKYNHVKLIHQVERNGMYGAIHLGISSSNGELLMYVNADDRIVPLGVRQMVKTLSLNKKYHVAYSNALFHFKLKGKYKEAKGRLYAAYFLKKGIFPFVQSSVIFTKAIYNDVGGLRFNEFKIAGDMDLFYRFAISPLGKFEKVNTTSSVFLKYGESLGDKNSNLAKIERANAKIPSPNFFVRLFYRVVTVIS